MADIEYSDGSSADIPRPEGETLAEFVKRQGEEMDAQFAALKKGLTDAGWGSLFEVPPADQPDD